MREYNSFLLIAAIFLFLRWVDQAIVRELGAGAWFRQDLPLTASVLALAVGVAAMRRIRKRGSSGH